MNKGTTLIEIIFYITISGIIFLASFSALHTLTQSKLKNQVNSELGYQGNIIMNQMLETIREADSIINPSNQLNSNLLSLEKDGNEINYELSENNILISRGISEPTALNNSKVQVIDLSFYNYSSSINHDSIRVMFTLQYTEQAGNNHQRQFYGTASIRQEK